MVSPKNFSKYDVNNISMRVMAQPISAEKMKVTIGIAPVPYDKLKKTNNFDDIGFPMVEVNSFSVDIFPKEDDETSHDGSCLLEGLWPTAFTLLRVAPSSTTVEVARLSRARKTPFILHYLKIIIPKVSVFEFSCQK